MHTCIPLLLRSPHTTKPMSLIPNPTAPSPMESVLLTALNPRAHDIEGHRGFAAPSRRRRGAGAHDGAPPKCTTSRMRRRWSSLTIGGKSPCSS